MAIFAAIAGLVYYIRTEDGKKEFDIIKLKIPLVGKVLRYVYLARFAENLSTLVRSGIADRDRPSDFGQSGREFRL